MNSNLLINQLRSIVGKKYVLTKTSQTYSYETGKRVGAGKVLAVIKPGTLVEQWRALNAIVEADCIIIMQAANTSLTGGSTPFGDYDRPVIIINTTRLTGIQLIQDASQVVCLPGATLDQLENTLSPFEREPHSVIGSSCIGASVLGGVCNNSGGALVRRGPAYTEYAIYAQVNAQNQLELVNHLGIQLGNTPEEILNNLEKQQYLPEDILSDTNKSASDSDYQTVVSQINENTPARFNSNPDKLYEASGSAGKICVFAVRLDTFKKVESEVFYIGSNNQDDLTKIRQFVLTQLEDLPIAGEYIHRDAYDIGSKYGKDVFLFIEKFGTHHIPKAFATKDKIDHCLKKLKLQNLSDRVIQFFVRLLPNHLPKKMNTFYQDYEHHLILRVETKDTAQVNHYLNNYFKENTSGDYFLCSAQEGRKAFLHRFAIAGAAIRYRDYHSKTVEDIVALDIALRRNDKEWFETLPFDLEQQIEHKIYYGHFLCHVFHQDYIIKKSGNPSKIEAQLGSLLDQRGAEYPAEHNVGHMYLAKEPLKKHYQKLDPTNQFNVGIGLTSRKKNWE